MESIKLDIENLSKRERSLLFDLIDKANGRYMWRPNNVWKPKDGERFYTIASTGRISMRRGNAEAQLEVGNCFRTYERADFHLERLKTIHRLKEIAADYYLTERENSKQVRCVLAFDTAKDKVTVLTTTNTSIGAEVYFPSETAALSAAKTVGTERLKKYYFQV